MRPLDETNTRWRETRSHSDGLASIQQAINSNNSTNPCISGCRSVCWKTFLLSRNGTSDSWLEPLRTGRDIYSRQRDHLLKYIEHPEALAELTVDPLADDPTSPWNTVRQDEIIRAEILQDVQRLPDEVDYHEEHMQQMILNILFIYCKTYPTRGGYRQGMHELLAPIVHVVAQDALDKSTVGNESSMDDLMVETLDASFIEHDAYGLFSKLMNHAQSFYEVQDEGSQSPSSRQDSSSAIVERSKFIHEVCLNKVDPDLANHLTRIEILPQIFLIRWVRLLFSREFPFEQFLTLWDTIFAVDPALELIDLICVAMLIRIRWQLLKADYAVCLQLLLKYPAPSGPNGPHTFVDDAVYLRDHLNAQGGAALVMKYTGRMPNTPKSTESSRATTPSFSGFNSIRQSGFSAISPLHSPTRFIQQQGGMEALFQGAAKGAKGVLERGEKLGINQAVRDAVGEIKKNMQGFNESRNLIRSPQSILSDEGAAQALAAMEKRNRQLASMLDETINSLRAVSTSNLEDKAKSLELIEVAAAKVQFVQIYLEDASMDVPLLVPQEAEATPLEDTKTFVENGSREEQAPKIRTEDSPLPVDVGDLTTKHTASSAKENAPELSTADDVTEVVKSTAEVSQPTTVESRKRPDPIPTRSTLAQSSFSWMLEPDEPQVNKAVASTSKSPPPQHKKKSSHNASREKNAFLFGDAIPEAQGGDGVNPDDIFGMQPIRKGKDS
ncbi:hypothetical protein S7711_05694 [Stachybotrys chartarum IBT 7711]|uniref:Rab-GAP TBC domain-containing protein n=1 Tax=Stachybotrys chartarum (strain CBS 109288 / IBT 7711) TaxID=1280523 RepID=A0A084B1K4_STACB|nr:hypothetical protein S7711_05694 [Stachybotrys chartarum IBT 7711]